MAEVRVTQTGVYVESEGSGVLVTQAGAYAELSLVELRATEFGAYAEIILREVRATQFGVYAELAEEQESVATYQTRSIGRRNTHTRIPDIVSGYAFDPIYSWWSTLLPESGVNEITEPSFELPIENYHALGWSGHGRITGDAIGATRGCYSYYLTVTPGFEGTFEYTTPQSIAYGPCSVSMDVYVPRAGLSLWLESRYFTTDETIARRTITFQRAGWQRIQMTYATLTNDRHIINLISPVTNGGGNIFRTDGWMLERKDYATSYFDGDMLGWYDKTPNDSYYWEGQPHFSRSVRSERTGSGGRSISFSDYAGFQSMGIVGLGLPAVENQAITLSSGVERARSTRFLPRDFTISGVLCADSWVSLSRKRQELIDLITPERTIGREPLVLSYQASNDDGSAITGALRIICKYQDGLAGGIESEYQERIGLVFHASDPFLKEEFDVAVHLDEPNEELASNAIVYRDENGLYQNLGTGTTTGLVHHAIFDGELNPIAVGAFTQLCGDVVSHVAKWDGTNWQNMMATPPDDSVLVAFHFPETGGIVIGGEFTEVDGILADRAAYYNPTLESWGGLAGISNGSVLSIEYDHYSRRFYFGGNWTLDAGLSEHVARLEGSSIDGGLVDTLPDGGLQHSAGGGSVLTILSTHDGYVYFGGRFTESEGGLYTGLYNVARLDQDTDTWEALGNGFNTIVNKLIQGQDGYIYAFGSFTRDGLDTYDLIGIARWNGSTWEQAHQINTSSALNATAATQDKDGIFWFGNQLVWTTTDIYGSRPFFGWRNGVLYPSPFYPPPTPADGFNGVASIVFGPNNEMLVVMQGDDAVVPTYAPKQYIVNYEGNARTYPLFLLRGYQTLAQIENHSTGGAMYFRDESRISLAERVFIDLRNLQPRFYSDIRANLTKQLYSGATNMNSMYLKPGTNRISILMLGLSDSNPPTNHLIWNNAYQSIDIAPEIL